MKAELELLLLERYGEILQEYWDTSKPVSPMIFGFECNDGWFEIIDDALSKITPLAREYFPLGFSVRQVKEKFGCLEIYLSNTNESLRKITRDASAESLKTCEVCGTKENVGITIGWYKTICEHCFNVSHLKAHGRRGEKAKIKKISNE